MNATGSKRSSRAGIARRGFSLIELIAVIVVMAILSISATMSMSGVAGNRQAAAARQIARDLSWLRERAMTTGRPAWATFNTSTDTYAFLGDVAATPGYANATAITDPATSRAFSQRLNAGDFAGIDMVSATDAAFGFDSRGRPIGTGGALLTTTITVSVTGSRSASVLAQTGKASWQ